MLANFQGNQRLIIMTSIDYLNSNFENLTIKLHVLYVLNIHTNFHINWLLFTIQSINSIFMHYFKLQKFDFK